MNFFQAVLHPDREELENAERAEVCKAANVLQVGEFQFLQLAYYEWFGEDLPQALIARLFTSYMLHNEVPHWARHYARVVMVRDETGNLGDDGPTYHRYDHDYHTEVPNGVRRFCTATGIITMALVSGILIASLSVKEPTSLLPPYFERDELRANPAQDMAWGRADKEPSGSGHP